MAAGSVGRKYSTNTDAAPETEPNFVGSGSGLKSEESRPKLSYETFVNARVGSWKVATTCQPRSQVAIV